MPEMSKYCRAYAVEDLREFDDWKGEPLPDSGYVFVHDDFVVTAGIFRDVQVLHGEPTPSWVRFCEDRLRFSVPQDVLEAADLATTD
jgi:hypothetical protein